MMNEELTLARAVAVLFLHSSFILLHLLLVATVPPRCAERLAAIGNGENFPICFQQSQIIGRIAKLIIKLKKLGLFRI
jgi:hypothetical protein